ncbi:MAG: acetolactate synthase small subunit [Spirochaetia bacterium]
MTTETALRKHTISLLVSNKPGVLIRISLVFARRAFNIDSLVVSETDDPSFSRMNIVATGDEETLEQILKQLNKLVDVIHATDQTGHDIIQRELALIKVESNSENRTDILQVASAFKCDPVDVGENMVTFEVTGSSEKLDSVLTVLKPFGLIEVVRTGKVLMAKGSELTS